VPADPEAPEALVLDALVLDVLVLDVLPRPAAAGKGPADEGGLAVGGLAAGDGATAMPVTVQYPSSMVPVHPGSGQGIAVLAVLAGVVMAAVPVC
jgi:hypothetical protein